MPKATQTRSPIPLHASLQVDPDRLDAMWRMSPDERNAAGHRGELSLGEMLDWAAKRPNEPAVLHGEFFFLAHLTPELADLDNTTPRR